MSRRRWAVWLVAGLLSLSACAGAGARTGPELTAFGAASLEAALEKAASEYERVTGTRVTVSTGSSATLRAQIEQGAPADLLLSADRVNPQALAAAGLADGAPVPFAANELVVIVPPDNPAGIRTPADLARDGVAVVAAAPGVPITAYAEAALARLSRLDGYPADFAAAYEANVVSREENASAVVTRIALGEADAAIVYATDAADPERVERVGLPQEANVTATYAGVVVRASDRRDAAREFLDWLRGAAGQAILADFGFLPAGA